MSVLGKVIAGVALAPIVIVVVGIGGCEARKAYYDWQVRKLCEQDGGVRISERIRVTAREVDHLPRVDGWLSFGSESLASSEAPAFARLRQTIVRQGNPTIVRYEEEIIRRKDGRVVARAVSYGRSGGDFPFPAEPSRFSCPELSQLYAAKSQIFEIVEGGK